MPSFIFRTGLIAEEYQGKLIYNNESGEWMRYEAEHPGVWSPETEDYMESIVSNILDGKGTFQYLSVSPRQGLLEDLCLFHLLLHQKQ